MIRMVKHDCGPRVYVFNRRCHHGSVGCGILALGILSRSRTLRLIAMAMIMHDHRDFPWTDERNH